MSDSIEYKEFVLYMKPGDATCDRLQMAMASKNMMEYTFIQDATLVTPRPTWLCGVPILVHQIMESGSSQSKAPPKRTAYRGTEAFKFVQRYSEPSSFSGFGGSSGGSVFDSGAYGYGEKGNEKSVRIGDATGAKASLGAGVNMFDERAYGYGQKGGGEARIAGAAGFLEGGLEDDGGMLRPPIVDKGNTRAGNSDSRSARQGEEDDSISRAAQAFLDARSASDQAAMMRRGYRAQ
jgi:hypothetical protein